MIHYRKIESGSDVSDYLSGVILKQLSKGSRVLWLLAGGSAMDVAIQTAQKLSGSYNLDKITISLTDERYGAPGHADSNWRQLTEKGFKLPGANMLPVLSGKDMAQTAQDYAQLLNRMIDSNGYSIALAGMGADGHIFGIKPHSPAVEELDDVSSYDWEDYRRITPTLKLLKKLDEVVMYVTGEEKHYQIDLLDRNLPDQEQPAQQLKRLKNVIFFNDYKGEVE